MIIQVLKKCHCVIKNDLENDIECDNKEMALDKAHEILDVLAKESCESHLFFIKKEEDKVIIDSKTNPNKGY